MTNLKKVLLVLSLVVATAAASFLLWMNLTPGYFQQVLCDRVGYYTDVEASSLKGPYLKGNLDIECMAVSWSQSLFGVLELSLAKLDFNKGPEVQSDLRNDFTTTTPKWDFIPSPDRKISGIKGTVVRHYCNGAAPADPPPGYKPCGEGPLSSFVLNIKNSTSGTEWRVTTDSDGKFTLELLPGRYTITKAEVGQAIMGVDTEVEVRFGLYTRGQLDYTELRP